jgi:hypothetical protein
MKMSVLDRIDEHLTENFARGKDAKYLAGWMVTMFKKRIRDIESASKVDNYGQINSVVSSTMNDLKMIKTRLDQIAKGQ